MKLIIVSLIQENVIVQIFILQSFEKWSLTIRNRFLQLSNNIHVIKCRQNYQISLCFTQWMNPLQIRLRRLKDFLAFSFFQLNCMIYASDKHTEAVILYRIVNNIIYISHGSHCLNVEHSRPYPEIYYTYYADAYLTSLLPSTIYWNRLSTNLVSVQYLEFLQGDR